MVFLGLMHAHTHTHTHTHTHILYTMFVYIYKVYKKNIKTEAVVTKIDMNNEWYIHFLESPAG